MGGARILTALRCERRSGFAARLHIRETARKTTKVFWAVITDPFMQSGLRTESLRCPEHVDLLAGHDCGVCVRQVAHICVHVLRCGGVER